MVPGTSMVVKVALLSRNPLMLRLLSRYRPTISPRGLIPSAGEIGSRCIDGRKANVAQQKTVKSEARAVQIKTNDVASGVDRIGDRENGSGHVDLRKLRRLTRGVGR